MANFNPQSMVRYRKGERNLKYRSLTGEVYEVESDFHNLLKLDHRLEKHFEFEDRRTVNIDVAEIKLDHYLMRKK